MWMWAGGLGIVGVALLLGDLHARATWTPPQNDASAVITLNQLLGFIVSGALIIIAGLILLTGYRRHRSRTRYSRRSAG
jgi:hypothetical protein